MKTPRYWLNLLSFALTVVLLGGLAGLVYAGYIGANAYVHPVRYQRPADETPALLTVPYQDIVLTTQDGLTLKAWYTPSQNGAVILVAHGFGGARSVNWHALFARYGYGVLSWDARAHGESGGSVSTFGYSEILDVKAAADFALAQPDVKRVGAWGGSMGAVTVIRAAAHQPQISAVVADSAFPAVDEMVVRVSPFAPLTPFIRFFAEQASGVKAEQHRPVEVIGEISPRPVFIIQGEADRTIPPDSAERLYAAAGEPRQLWTEPGVGHVAMYRSFGAEYERRVIEFFNQALLD